MDSLKISYLDDKKEKHQSHEQHASVDFMGENCSGYLDLSTYGDNYLNSKKELLNKLKEITEMLNKEIEIISTELLTDTNKDAT